MVKVVARIRPVAASLAGGSLAAVAAMASISATAQSSDAGRCSVEAIQPLAPAGTTIQSATSDVTPAGHCKIEGYATSPGGNRNHFRLQLPDRFAGRYYFIGLGGAAGYVPTESQLPIGNPLIKGFAVAGTDTGHQASSADWSFIARNREQAIDHTARGAHLVAVATQAITRGYYRTDRIYRYHSGCSGGGRMGMQAISHYPGDYDGLLVGAPVAVPTPDNYTMVMFAHMGQQLTREPGAWLSPQKLALADARITRLCDGLDGAADGIVSEPGLCRVDLRQELGCKPGGDPGQCLTGPEITTIDALLAGPAGLKPGWPIANMKTWSQYLGYAPPPWPKALAGDNWQKVSFGYLIGENMLKTLFGPQFDPLKDLRFDDRAALARQMQQMHAASEKLGFSGTYATDLRPFQQSGGKAIIWNGISDVSALDADAHAYYALAGRHTGGGIEHLRQFMRLYSVPGMGHCGGGNGPEDAPDRLLDALIAWVEQGRTPEAVVTHRGASAMMQFAKVPAAGFAAVGVPNAQGGARDFLICPAPEKAAFTGSPGGEMDARNWECRRPAAPRRPL